MNNKILSAVLVAGIATTGFAGISAANNSGNVLPDRSEMRELFEKAKSGENLTPEEQTLFEEIKEHKNEKWERRWFGKRMGMRHLTDEEKTALESMSAEEKKEFFASKKAQREAEHLAHKNIIDKLMAGESLTAAEEATRLEMISKFEEMNDHPRKWKSEHKQVISKLLAGDELTDDEEASLQEMKVKHEQREAKKALISPIMAKLDAGEELTDQEKKILEENRPQRKGGRGHHWKGECKYDKD